MASVLSGDTGSSSTSERARCERSCSNDEFGSVGILGNAQRGRAAATSAAPASSLSAKRSIYSAALASFAHQGNAGSSRTKAPRAQRSRWPLAPRVNTSRAARPPQAHRTLTRMKGPRTCVAECPMHNHGRMAIHGRELDAPHQTSIITRIQSISCTLANTVRPWTQTEPRASAGVMARAPQHLGQPVHAGPGSRGTWSAISVRTRARARAKIIHTPINNDGVSA